MVILAQGAPQRAHWRSFFSPLLHQQKEEGALPSTSHPPTHTRTHTHTHTHTGTLYIYISCTELWVSSLSRNWDSFISELPIALIVPCGRGRMVGHKKGENKRLSRRSQGRSAVCTETEKEEKGNAWMSPRPHVYCDLPQGNQSLLAFRFDL